MPNSYGILVMVRSQQAMPAKASIPLAAALYRLHLGIADSMSMARPYPHDRHAVGDADIEPTKTPLHTCLSTGALILPTAA